ncbi:MAG: gliding motility lipoprotein GldB, partial [Cytophagales bacterium]|nr:gliding motility lipoprotein GldB [Cytophagales bacterium]
VNLLFNLSQDKSIDTLKGETDAYFGEMNDIKVDLEQAFAFVKHYFPDFTIPKVYTVVTGFGHDMYASDSIVVIGLDYFLGDKGKYRPDIPNYMLRRFKKEYIVPSIVLLLSDKYNTTNVLDNTLLADMIHYGKSYYFVEKILPCTPDSLVMGYSEKELVDTKKHESVVWAHFVEQKLLFETSHFIVNKYVGERPYTAEIGSKCPGRIGRWLGWQIVNKYMKDHPSATLEEIMKEKDAAKIFNESHYKPEK